MNSTYKQSNSKSITLPNSISDDIETINRDINNIHTSIIVLMKSPDSTIKVRNIAATKISINSILPTILNLPNKIYGTYGVPITYDILTEKELESNYPSNFTRTVQQYRIVKGNVHALKRPLTTDNDIEEFMRHSCLLRHAIQELLVLVSKLPSEVQD